LTFRNVDFRTTSLGDNFRLSSNFSSPFSLKKLGDNRKLSPNSENENI